MSKSTLKILPALIVAITAAFVTTQPVFGQNPPHEFVFTENSSTSLLVNYDGLPLTVNLTSPDHWTFSLPSSFVPGRAINVQPWTEPDNSNSMNVVNFGVAGISLIGLVQSDFQGFIDIPANADGASVLVGTDGGDPVIATFHDNAATAEATVPDTGTTFPLFGLSLMGLAFFRRQLWISNNEEK